MNFFHKESKSKKINKNFFLGGGRGDRLGDWGGGGVGVGWGGTWMDSRTGPNQFAPSTSSKLGA